MMMMMMVMMMIDMCLHDSGSSYILAFPTQPSATTRRLAMSQLHGVNTSGVSQPTEKRRANDGEWYTHAQFKSHYGERAYWHWVSAEKQTAPDASDASHFADGCGPPLPRVPPPSSITPLAGSGASDGAHLAGDDRPLQALPPCPVLTLDETPPAPTATNYASGGAHLVGDCGPPLPRVPPPSSTTPPAGSGASDGAHLASDDGPLQALPPRPVLTLEQLRNRAPVQGMGGKAACEKQRELRAMCLSTGSFHIDLTNDAWNWRDVLRSMPAAMQAAVVGPGVTQFSFRLLKNELDHNYARIDSGERHVFEITRGDGSTCHLHYHKNGNMDPPRYPGPPEASLDTASNRSVTQPAGISLGGGADPTVYSAIHILTPNSHIEQPVGKNEAHVACHRLLALAPQAKGIDVTDSVGFPWQRFLRTQQGGRDIIGPGVSQVCVVPRAKGPSLAFFRTDGLAYIVTPSNMRAVPPYEVLSQTEAGQCRATHHAERSWMQC